MYDATCHTLTLFQRRMFATQDSGLVTIRDSLRRRGIVEQDSIQRCVTQIIEAGNALREVPVN